jgi:hypothetical protein
VIYQQKQNLDTKICPDGSLYLHLSLSYHQSMLSLGLLDFFFFVFCLNIFVILLSSGEVRFGGTFLPAFGLVWNLI